MFIFPSNRQYSLALEALSKLQVELAARHNQARVGVSFNSCTARTIARERAR